MDHFYNNIVIIIITIISFFHYIDSWIILTYRTFNRSSIIFTSLSIEFLLGDLRE